MRPVILAGLAALACGGGTSIAGGPVQPATSASQAMTTFMRAAADSNLARMAELWGSADGPAARTGQPPEWEKRVIIMQAYLRGDSSRVVTDVPVSGSDSQRRVIVALYRAGCVKQIPAVVTRAKSGGWLVENVDISAAGNPARPCEDPQEELTR
ncbi:MAG TPA: hypothetical protein VLB00_06225 [Gemmatimonadales bacterium]|nr:hypothetical protein [Gemmatimonadales bacterium]